MTLYLRRTAQEGLGWPPPGSWTTRRPGFVNAARQVVIGDGAPWIWNVAGSRRHPSRRHLPRQGVSMRCGDDAGQGPLDGCSITFATGDGSEAENHGEPAQLVHSDRSAAAAERRSGAGPGAGRLGVARGRPVEARRQRRHDRQEHVGRRGVQGDRQPGRGGGRERRSTRGGLWAERHRLQRKGARSTGPGPGLRAGAGRLRLHTEAGRLRLPRFEVRLEVRARRRRRHRHRGPSGPYGCPAGCRSASSKVGARRPWARESGWCSGSATARGPQR